MSDGRTVSRRSVMAGAGVAYGLGAPALLAYAAIIVAALAVLPGYDRWDRRQHPR